MQSLETDSTIETHIIPTWARTAGLLRCFMYRGSSMTPTFRPGHLLYVRPTACDITPGDVVVFADPSEKDYVVHRVVSATDAGLITRGDNNSRYDLPLVLDQVIGRVEVLEHQGCLKSIRGGSGGLWSARIRWGVLQVGKWLRHVFSAPYRALRHLDLVHRALNWLFFRQFKVVHLHTPDGPLFIVNRKQRIVARWWPQQDCFECKKPYDLVIRREDLAQQVTAAKSCVK
jgi:hypothetical protein